MEKKQHAYESPPLDYVNIVHLTHTQTHTHIIASVWKIDHCSINTGLYTERKLTINVARLHLHVQYAV